MCLCVFEKTRFRERHFTKGVLERQAVLNGIFYSGKVLSPRFFEGSVGFWIASEDLGLPAVQFPAAVPVVNH